MKIIIIGNIGAGKSTLAELLKKHYKTVELLSIDNIRKLHGNGTIEKEKFCKDKFIKLAKNKNTIHIIELTGIGELGNRLFRVLDKKEYTILVIQLIVKKGILIDRVKDRKWDTPFPIGVEKIPIAIEYTEKQFEKGLLNNLILKNQKAIYLSLDNSNKKLMNRNFRLIVNNIDFIIKNM
jgi:dephospho-CoA kinase